MTAKLVTQFELCCVLCCNVFLNVFTVLLLYCVVQKSFPEKDVKSEWFYMEHVALRKHFIRA